MTENALIYQKYLESNDLAMEVNELDTDTYFLLTQQLQAGPPARIIQRFSEDDGLVAIQAVGIGKLSNPSRRDYIYELLNELNNQYTVIKFTMEESNEIVVAAYLPFSDNFKPIIVIDTIIAILRIMEEIYPRFMKVFWS